MNLFDKLKDYGINAEEGLARFMGNEGLYTRMLKKLPHEIEKYEVLSFMDSGDFKTALENAHTLKGVSGNLSVIPLYEAYDKIVKLLRAGNNEEARSVMEGLLPVQKDVVECINAD